MLFNLNLSHTEFVPVTLSVIKVILNLFQDLCLTVEQQQL